jgi:hypothetical protein
MTEAVFRKLLRRLGKGRRELTRMRCEYAGGCSRREAVAPRVQRIGVDHYRNRRLLEHGTHEGITRLAPSQSGTQHERVGPLNRLSELGLETRSQHRGHGEGIGQHGLRGLHRDR